MALPCRPGRPGRQTWPAAQRGYGPGVVNIIRDLWGRDRERVWLRGQMMRVRNDEVRHGMGNELVQGAGVGQERLRVCGPVGCVGN